jgi:hypothetical protein
MSNRAIAGPVAVLALSMVAPVASAADSPLASLAWHAQVSTTAMRANQVLPLPLSLGLSAVLSQGILGFEAGFAVNGATICDSNDSGHERDGFCGLLLAAEAGPRLVWPTARRWSPYLSTKGQWLRMTRANQGSFAIAPRVGVAYTGDRLSAFAEIGASVVVGEGEEDWRLTGGASGGRVLPALTAGIRI